MIRDQEEDNRPTIVDALRNEILSGLLKGGEQLRQDALAARFGVSKIPVREALSRLEAEGLVAFSRNRGATVVDLSPPEVLELFDIRIALECRAIFLAVPDMTESDFALMSEILERYDRASDPQEWSELNQAFHDALYAPCDRPRLLGLVHSNLKNISRFLRVLISSAVGKEQPIDEHRVLLEACRRGEAEAAATLLEKHILHTQKAFSAAMRRTRKSS